MFMPSLMTQSKLIWMSRCNKWWHGQHIKSLSTAEIVVFGKVYSHTSYKKTWLLLTVPST